MVAVVPQTLAILLIRCGGLGFEFFELRFQFDLRLAKFLRSSGTGLAAIRSHPSVVEAERRQWHVTKIASDQNDLNEEFFELVGVLATKFADGRVVDGSPFDEPTEVIANGESLFE